MACSQKQHIWKLVLSAICLLQVVLCTHPGHSLITNAVKFWSSIYKSMIKIGQSWFNCQSYLEFLSSLYFLTYVPMTLAALVT